VVRKRRQAGYSLAEILVALSIFCAFLAILFILTAEMRGWDKRLPMNYARNPQVASVIARMRRDVLDAYMPHWGSPYVKEHEGFLMNEKVLILQTLRGGTTLTIIWDFREQGVVARYEYLATFRQAQWFARGVPPEFSSGVGIAAVKIPDREWGARLQAKDAKGKLAIDQIFIPRTHK
jgi:prepilin-type N-terminal cleavage/methylation domain-containing protein